MTLGKHTAGFAAIAALAAATALTPVAAVAQSDAGTVSGAHSSDDYTAGQSGAGGSAETAGSGAATDSETGDAPASETAQGDATAGETGSATAQGDAMRDGGTGAAQTDTAQGDAMDGGNGDAGQTDTAQGDAQGDTQQGIAYNDETLGQFVEAAQAVSAVRQDYAGLVQRAESEAQAQAIVQEALVEMQSAIQEVDGMDVDTYTAIGEAAQTDQELAARITAIARDAQEGAPSGG